MKSIKMLMMAALTIVSVSIFAQTKSETKNNSEKIKVEKTFACPMKCEGDKTYAVAGKCPECGMNLKEISTPVYACPMKCEGDKTYEKVGKCPECGMNLRKIEKVAKTFSCPMKCEGDKTYLTAGTCPKCGMNLKEKKEDHSGHKH